VFAGVVLLCSPVRSAKSVPAEAMGGGGRGRHVCAACTTTTSMDKVKTFEAHTDYIRSVAVHPTLPCVPFTSSDDMLIELWDWDKGWACTQLSRATPTTSCRYAAGVPLPLTRLLSTSCIINLHAVGEEARDKDQMAHGMPIWSCWVESNHLLISALCAACYAACLARVVFNPKDTNTFASASLDRTIKVSQPPVCLHCVCHCLGSLQGRTLAPSWYAPGHSMDIDSLCPLAGLSACRPGAWDPRPQLHSGGHGKGVNCLDYFTGGDRPYLLSGSDETVKVQCPLC